MANKKTLIWDSSKYQIIDSNKLVATETANGSGDFNMLFPVPLSAAGQYSRIYQFENGDLFYTKNALWNDATSEWNADDVAQVASAFRFDLVESKFFMYTNIYVYANWTTWDQTVELAPNGVTTAPGEVEAYFAAQSYTPVITNIGCGVNFPKRFPSFPSSFSVTVTSSFNIDVPSVTPGYAPEPSGCGVYGSTLAGGNAYMYGYIRVS